MSMSENRALYLLDIILYVLYNKYNNANEVYDMNYVIELNFESDEAIYIQLCNQILRGIALGEIREGESLPSVRQLADDISINMHTVNKAYSILKDEGFVKLDRRSGAVVRISPDKARVLQRMKHEFEPAVIRGICNNVTRDEAIALINKLYDDYEV